MIERHCARRRSGPRMRADSGAQLVAPAVLNQFLLRFGDSDEATLATIEEIQRRGAIFVGPARWRGQWVMRFSVCSYATEMEQLPLVRSE